MARRHLLDLRDVACDRRRRDQVLVAERRLLPETIEMTFGAIALNGADGAGMARVLVAGSGLLDGEGVFVGAGRGRSRRVVGHVL